MPIDVAGSHIPTCYASCSIGTKPSDTLPQKLNEISSAGFDAIELSFPDLLSFANDLLNKNVSKDDYDDLCTAGKVVRRMCEALGLEILVLQPFSNFEGWAKDSPQRKDAFDRARGWMQIMEAVGTSMLQVGGTSCQDPD